MKGNSAAAGDLRGVGPGLPKLCLQTVTDEDAEQSGWLKAQLRVFEVYVDGRMPTELKTVLTEGGSCRWSVPRNRTSCASRLCRWP